MSNTLTVLENVLSEHPTITFSDTDRYLLQEPVVLPATVDSIHARFEYPNVLKLTRNGDSHAVKIRAADHELTTEKLRPALTDTKQLFDKHTKHRTEYLLRTLTTTNPTNTLSSTEIALIEQYDSLYDFYIDFHTESLPSDIDRESIIDASTTYATHYRNDDNTYYHTEFTCPECEHTQKLMHKVNPGSSLHQTRNKLAPYFYCANCPNTDIPQTHMLSPTEIHTR